MYQLRQNIAKTPIIGRFFVLLLSGLMLPLAAQANEPGLTLASAIERSFQAHPELGAFQYRRKIAEGNVMQAGVGTKPTLDLQIEDGYGSGQYPDAENLQTTLGISWVLEGELLDQRQHSARQGSTLLYIDYQITRLDVAAETGRRFMALLALQQQSALAEQALAMAQRTVKELRQREQAGKTSAVDSLRAKAAMARYALAVEDLEHEMRSQRRELAALWQRRGMSEALLGDLAAPRVDIDFTALSTALNRNPYVERLLTQKRISQSELALAKAEAKSRWRISAGVRRFEATDDVALVAGLSIPLGGQSRSQGRFDSLQAEADLQAANAKALRLALEARLYVLVQEYQHARHVAESLRQDILPSLKLALSEAERGYQLGRHTYQEWAAVQREWLTAREDLLDSQLSAQLTYLEIERLTGAPTLLINEVTP